LTRPGKFGYDTLNAADAVVLRIVFINSLKDLDDLDTRFLCDETSDERSFRLDNEAELIGFFRHDVKLV